MQLSVYHVYLEILKWSGSLTHNSTNSLVPPHNGTGTISDNVEGNATNIFVEDTSSLQYSVSLSAKGDYIADYARMWVCGSTFH